MRAQARLGKKSAAPNAGFHKLTRLLVRREVLSREELFAARARRICVETHCTMLCNYLHSLQHDGIASLTEVHAHAPLLMLQQVRPPHHALAAWTLNELQASQCGAELFVSLDFELGDPAMTTRTLPHLCTATTVLEFHCFRNHLLATFAS